MDFEVAEFQDFFIEVNVWRLEVPNHTVRNVWRLLGPQTTLCVAFGGR